MGMQPQGQEPRYWEDMLVPESPHIVSTRIWRPAGEPTPKREGSVGATVRYDGTLVPDREGDTACARLCKIYRDLCASEGTMPLTAMALFSRREEDGTTPQSTMGTKRHDVALPPESFWVTNMTSSSELAFGLNERALERIATLCTEPHTVSPSELGEFLDGQDGMTRLLLNDSTHRELTGRNMHPDDWGAGGWYVHPCLADPTRGFEMRGKGAAHGSRNGLAAAVDWTVPDGKVYLVDGRGLRLHVGPRAVYYQDGWLSIEDRHGLEVLEGVRGMEITIRAQGG